MASFLFRRRRPGLDILDAADPADITADASPRLPDVPPGGGSIPVAEPLWTPADSPLMDAPAVTPEPAAPPRRSFMEWMNDAVSTPFLVGAANVPADIAKNLELAGRAVDSPNPLIRLPARQAAGPIGTALIRSAPVREGVKASLDYWTKEAIRRQGAQSEQAQAGNVSFPEKVVASAVQSTPELISSLVQSAVLPEVAAPKGLIRAAKALGAGPKLTSFIENAVGSSLRAGLPEAMSGGAQNAIQVGQQIRAMPADELAAIPGFAEQLALTDPNLPEAQRIEQAREAAVIRAENIAGPSTAATTFAGSVLAGGGVESMLSRLMQDGGARGVKEFAKRILSGAAKEVPEELTQTAAETIITNHLTGKPLLEGMGEALSVAGGAAVLLGGAGGAASGAAPVRSETPPPLPQTSPQEAAAREQLQGEFEDLAAREEAGTLDELGRQRLGEVADALDGNAPLLPPPVPAHNPADAILEGGQGPASAQNRSALEAIAAGADPATVLGGAPPVAPVATPPVAQPPPPPMPAPARPDVVRAWDQRHRSHRSEEWFTGGNADPAARAGWQAALERGGDQLAAHGMSKVGTLSKGWDDLIGMVRNGLDPRRGQGRLHTAPLVTRPGESTGTTASGSAYNDGPFVLVARPGQELSGNLEGLGAILINEAHAEIADAVRAEIHKTRPDIIVATYSQAGDVVSSLNGAQSVSPAAPSPAPPVVGIPLGKKTVPVSTARIQELMDSGLSQDQATAQAAKESGDAGRSFPTLGPRSDAFKKQFGNLVDYGGTPWAVLGEDRVTGGVLLFDDKSGETMIVPLSRMTAAAKIPPGKPVPPVVPPAPPAPPAPSVAPPVPPVVAPVPAPPVVPPGATPPSAPPVVKPVPPVVDAPPSQPVAKPVPPVAPPVVQPESPPSSPSGRHLIGFAPVTVSNDAEFTAVLRSFFRMRAQRDGRAFKALPRSQRMTKGDAEFTIWPVAGSAKGIMRSGGTVYIPRRLMKWWNTSAKTTDGVKSNLEADWTKIVADEKARDRRASQYTNENLSEWKSSIRSSGIGLDMSLEDMGLADIPGIRRANGMAWDDALTLAFEYGLITEDELTDPSAIGRLWRTPIHQRSGQATAERDQAEGALTQLLDDGDVLPPNDPQFKGFPELRKRNAETLKKIKAMPNVLPLGTSVFLDVAQVENASDTEAYAVRHYALRPDGLRYVVTSGNEMLEVAPEAVLSVDGETGDANATDSFFAEIGSEPSGTGDERTILPPDAGSQDVDPVANGTAMPETGMGGPRERASGRDVQSDGGPAFSASNPDDLTGPSVREPSASYLYSARPTLEALRTNALTDLRTFVEGQNEKSRAWAWQLAEWMAGDRLGRAPVAPSWMKAGNRVAIQDGLKARIRSDDAGGATMVREGSQLRFAFTPEDVLQAKTPRVETAPAPAPAPAPAQSTHPAPADLFAHLDRVGANTSENRELIQREMNAVVNPAPLPYLDGLAPADSSAPSASAEPVKLPARSSYDDIVAANMKHMGTSLGEWSAVAVKRMATTKNDRGDAVEMPEFDFPSGYTSAPSLFKNAQSGGDLCCELCGHAPIKNLFHIQNDTRRWTMAVGSECVTRFGENKSGAQHVKAERARIAMETIRSMRTTREQLRAVRVFSRESYGRIPGEVDTALTRLSAGMPKGDGDLEQAQANQWASTKGKEAATLLANADAIVARYYAEALSFFETQMKVVEKRLATYRGNAGDFYARHENQTRDILAKRIASLSPLRNAGALRVREPDGGLSLWSPAARQAEFLPGLAPFQRRATPRTKVPSVGTPPAPESKARPGTFSLFTGIATPADVRSAFGDGESVSAFMLNYLKTGDISNVVGMTVTKPADVFAALWFMRSPVAESFKALYLDENQKIISAKIVTLGILDASLVHPREIFAQAPPGTKSLILSHNHPSGDPTPSAEDARVTRMVIEAGRIAGIAVADHVVTNGSRYVSLRESGLASFDIDDAPGVPGTPPKVPAKKLPVVRTMPANNGGPRDLAPWEFFPIEQAASIRTPLESSRVASVLRQANHGMGHMLLVNSRRQMIGALRFPMENASPIELMRMLMRHADGVSAVIVDLPGSITDHIEYPNLMREMVRMGKTVDIRILDGIDGNNTSMRDSGLVNFVLEDGAPYGADDSTLRETPRFAAVTGVTTKQDREYMAAVERVDTSTAQRMVDEAAQRAGYKMVAYHGTHSDFTQFMRSGTSKGPSKVGFWFADQRDFAEMYGDKIMNSRLLLRRPKRMQMATWDRLRELHARDQSYWRKWRDDLIAAGHDGVVVSGREVSLGGGRIEFLEPSVIAVFDAKAIKSADPVTRDDAGNVIPLSQRFNAQSPDIRFAAADRTRGEDERLSLPTLVAIHNLSASNLVHSADLGGIPVPSVAITRPDIPFTGFGEISLLGNRALIDPQTSATRIFDADAWTTRHPDVVWSKVRMAKADAISKRFHKAQDDSGDHLISNEVWDRMVSRPDKNAAVDRMLRSYAAKLQFLRENGRDVTPVMRKKNRRHTFSDDPALVAWVKAHPGLRNARLGEPLWAEFSKQAADALDRHAAKMMEGEADDSLVKNYIEHAREDLFDDDGKTLMFGRGDSLISDVWAVGQTELDRYETENAITAEVKAMPDGERLFETWIRKIMDVYEPPRIKVGGRLVAYTLDNIVEAMTSTSVRGKEQGMTFSTGKARGAGAREFTSVESMKREQDSLRSKEALEQYVNEVQKPALDEYQKSAMNNRRGDQSSAGFGSTWETLDDSMKALADYLKGGHSQRSEARMRRALAKNYFRTDTDYFIEDALDAAHTLADAPTEYFEAKLLRGVPLDDFSAAVIPDTTPEEARSALARSGLQVIEYKQGDEAARQRAVAEMSDRLKLRFSARSAESSRGPSVDEVRSAIANVATNLRGVDVVDDVADLAPSDRAMVEQGMTAQGVTGIRGIYMPDGRIILVASNLRDTDDALGVLFHETGERGMGLLRQLNGEAMGRILDGIYAKRMDRVQTYRRAWARVEKAYPGMDRSTEAGRRDFAREVLAHIAENRRKMPTLWRTLLREIRQFFARLADGTRFAGIFGEMTDPQVERMVDLFLRAGADPAGADRVAFATALEKQARAWAYSAVLRAVETAKQPKAPGAQWSAWLKNQPGVKAEELQWLGVSEWLSNRATVTREDLAAFIRANQVEVTEVVKGRDAQATRRAELQAIIEGGVRDLTPAEEREFDSLTDNIVMQHGDVRFGQYQLPGGSNYRELLLTLPWRPEHGTESLGKDGEFEYFIDGEFQGRGQEAGIRAHVEAMRENPALAVRNIEMRPTRKWTGLQKPAFQSSHFSEPNILAHVRFNERTDADGKRVLFIEEVQSDWHQQGRENGYALTEAEKALVAKPATNQEEFSRQQELIRRGDASIPDAPFKTTWPLLAMKRMIRWAAENGFDRIAWTTGDQQAERYDLSKQVSAVGVVRDSDGTYGISAKTENGVVTVGRGIPTAKLSEYVGKDLAAKIVANEGTRDVGEPDNYQRFTGASLKVGGEGMRAFYDSILPAEVSKYAKKWGGKVGRTAIDVEQRMGLNERSVVELRTLEAMPEYELTDADRTRRDGLRALKQRASDSAVSQSVHSLDITPAMRAAALAGEQPLFAASRTVDATGKPAFKRWFGASKVVDAQGRPLVVFHGTKSDFNAFDIRKSGASDAGLVGRAFYFTTTREQAGDFAENKWYGRGTSPNVMPVFVSITNPFYITDGILPDGRRLTDVHRNGISSESGASLKKLVRDSGHDGVIFRHSSGEISQVVAFAPAQIKSATGNVGTFAPSNPDIRFAATPPAPEIPVGPDGEPDLDAFFGPMEWPKDLDEADDKARQKRFKAKRGDSESLSIRNALRLGFDTRARKAKFTSQRARLNLMQSDAEGLIALRAYLDTNPSPALRSRTIRRTLTKMIGNAEYVNLARAVKNSPDRVVEELEAFLNDEISGFYSRRMTWLLGRKEFVEAKLHPDVRAEFRELVARMPYERFVALRSEIDKLRWYKDGKTVQKSPAEVEAQQDAVDLAAQKVADSIADVGWEQVKDWHDAAAGIWARSNDLQYTVRKGIRMDRKSLAAGIQGEIEASAPALKGTDTTKGRAVRGWSEGRFTDVRLNQMGRAEQLSGGNPNGLAAQVLGQDLQDAEVKQLNQERAILTAWKAKQEALGIGDTDWAEWSSDLKEYTINGQKITLTTAEIMDLYATMLDPENALELTRAPIKLRRLNGLPVGVKFGKDDDAVGILEDFTLKNLTGQQRELVRYMVKALTDMGEGGNLVSRALYGTDLFTKTVYWPRERDITDRSPEALADIDDLRRNRPRMLEHLGLTKERVTNIHGLMLSNAAMKFAQHVHKMTAYTHLTIPVGDALAVLQDGGVGSAIRSRYGSGYISTMRDLFERLAGLRRYSDGWTGIQKFMATIERNASVATLWGRVSTIIFNRVGGSIMTMSELEQRGLGMGAKYLKYLGGPGPLFWKNAENARVRDLLLERNGYLWKRWSHDFVQVQANLPIDEAEAVASTYRVWLRKIQEVGMRPMALAEMKNAVATFRVLVDSGMSEDRAIREVEQIVRATQNPSSAMQESVIFEQVKKSGLGIIFPFLGQPTVAAALLARDMLRLSGASKAGKPTAREARNLALTAGGLFASAVMTAMVRAAFRAATKGEWPPDDPDEEAQRAGLQMLSEAMDTLLPGSGKALDAVAGLVDRGVARDTSQLGRITEALSGALRDSAELSDGDFDPDRAARALDRMAQAVSMLTGLPYSGPMQTVKAAAGASGNPIAQNVGQ